MHCWIFLPNATSPFRKFCTSFLHTKRRNIVLVKVSPYNQLRNIVVSQNSYKFYPVPLPNRKGIASDALSSKVPTAFLKGMGCNRSVCFQKRLAASSKQAGSEKEILPADGLTRFPNFSPPGILRGLDYLGTIVFALAGTVTAATVGMDVLGCSIVGTITAIGGGTIRDILLGSLPVFWVVETEYMLLSLATCLATFFGWEQMKKMGIDDGSDFLQWWDAVGVGAFCVIGTQHGVRRGLHPVITLFCGLVTACGGGVVRDVLCQKHPRILYSEAEVYASCALAGSSMYLVTAAAGCSPAVKIGTGFGIAVFSRYLAWTKNAKLPAWTVDNNTPKQ